MAETSTVTEKSIERPELSKWIAKYTNRDYLRILQSDDTQFQELLNKANKQRDKLDYALRLHEMIEENNATIQVKYEGSIDDALQKYQIRWLAKNLIARRHISMFTGPSAMGKTYLAINLALSLITNTNFANKYEINDNFKIAYFVGEGQEGFGERLVSACVQFGLNRIPDGFYNYIPDLKLESCLYDTIEFLSRENNQPDLIIFDTFSTALRGDDAIGDNTITAIRNLQTIASYLDCAILCIHHPKKNQQTGYRGHSSIENNVDNLFSAVKRKGKLYFEKNKDRDSNGQLNANSTEYVFSTNDYGSIIEFGETVEQIIEEDLNPLFETLLEAFEYDYSLELTSNELKSRLDYSGKDISRDFNLKQYCNKVGKNRYTKYTLIPQDN